MGWHEPPAEETVGGGEAREAQWERARGEGAERDLVGWGQDGQHPHAPGSNATYKQTLDRVFRRAARARRSNTPAVAIMLVQAIASL